MDNNQANDSFDNYYNREARDIWAKRPLLGFTISLTLFLIIVGCIIATVYVISNGHEDIFSEFYVLGKNSKADDYPSQLKLGDESAVTLGVVNHEYSRQIYTIDVWISGVFSETIGPTTLENGEKWETAVTIRPATNGNNQKVEFILYRQFQNSKETNKPLSLRFYLNVN